MKRFLTLLLILMLLCSVSLAESAQWTDGMYVLGETGYTVVLPEGMISCEPDEDQLLSATMETMQKGEGGLSISISYVEGQNIDDYYTASFAELKEVVGADFQYIYSSDMPNAYTMYSLVKASGSSCAYIAGGRMTYGPAQIKVMSAELFHREVIGMMASVIIPDGENLYVVNYSITADYMDSLQNIMEGTIAYEE